MSDWSLKAIANLFGYDLSQPDMAKWARFSRDLLAVLLGTALFVGFLVAFAASRESLRQLEYSMDIRARTIATAVSRASFVPMMLESKEDLSSVLRAYEETADLSYLTVEREDGSTAAEIRPSAAAGATDLRVASHPIGRGEQTLGRVKVGLARDRIVALSRANLRRNIAISMLLAAASFALGFLVIRTMTVRLRALVREAELAEALRRSNAELEQFAYAVSHDLRAPLRHVLGFIQLLEKRTDKHLDDKSRHFIATITEAATRMGQLIEDLLEYSRVGRSELKKRPVKLTPLFEAVRAELESESKDRQVEWTIGDLPEVQGDPTMMRLVVQNYVANALKFTRNAAPAKIEVGQVLNGAGKVTVYVRDNGVGFDMRYRHKLFGVFQRLHSEEEFEGTGIGLANVRRIVERHGGRTWAESEPGKGATFYFSLPTNAENG